MATAAISPVALVSLAILLFEHCTTVTLTRYTQQRVNAPRALAVVVVLLTECLKLLLATTLELSNCFGMGSGRQMKDLRAAIVDKPYETLRVSVPAALYTLQNILIFVALGNLEVVSFQVLYQTKLMLTAVLSVHFLGRSLTRRQWIALGMLTLGVVSVELSDGDLMKKASSGRRLQQLVRDEALATGRAAPVRAARLPGSSLDTLTSLGTHVDALMDDGGWDVVRDGRQLSKDQKVGREKKHAQRVGGKVDGGAGAKGARNASGGRIPALGVLAALAAATLSSFAGVYFEALVKGKEVSPPSLWVRNVQLCIFTIPLAGVAVGGKWEAVRDNGFWYGIDTPTIVLIVLNASGGLLVAAVIKYGDNILKNFTTACSVILGTLISVVLFDFVLTVQFLWGSALVVASAYAYATAPPSAAVELKPSHDEEEVAAAETEEYKPLADGSARGDSTESEESIGVSATN